MDARAGERMAREQAALRQVAVLVTAGASPEQVFAAVAAEAGRLLDADLTAVARYEPGGAVTLGAWNSAGSALPASVGRWANLGGYNMVALVSRAGRPVRIDDYGDATGSGADVGRSWGIQAAVGAPITVEGRLWGLMVVGSRRGRPLPADAEARLAGFTELAGIAIANAQTHVELRGYADEQAALRRVATMVADGAPPERVFAAVTEEAGRLLDADITIMGRYDADGTAVIVGESAETRLGVDVGKRLRLGGENVTTMVHRTGEPARVDDYRNSSGDWGQSAYRSGVRAAAGVPVRVGGRLWGVVIAGSTIEASMPPDSETRLAAFTELAAIAVANAEAQTALAASRARIVAAADEARRRIERNLHDGAQQQLATVALQLGEARATAPAGAVELVRRLDEIAAGLEAALEDLREVARGIHPAALAEGGLGPALKALARRYPIPAGVRVRVPDRLPAPVEIAAYYVVSEALTNTAKHADATAADIEVATGEGELRVGIRDDGRGGADFARGSGLVGLRDRVEALGGRLTLHSPPGEGTTLDVRIPASSQAYAALSASSRPSGAVFSPAHHPRHRPPPVRRGGRGIPASR